MSNIDWAATGSMLQGIGTILGALAVLAAAAIGGTTFNTWKKQQLLQRQIELAEKILSGVFKAREALAAARSPLMQVAELEEAKTQLAQEIDLDSLSEQRKAKVAQAQAYLNRINQGNDALLELEESKALTFAYFGDEVPTQIDRILKVASDFRWNANFLAEDDGADSAYSRQIRRALTSSRARDDDDEYASEIESAIQNIESVVTPFIRNASQKSENLIDELPSTLLEVVVRSLISIR